MAVTKVDGGGKWTESQKLTFGLAALMMLAGCGTATGSISGNVKFDGKPIPVGDLAVVSEDGGVHRTKIVDGSYTIDGVPPGPVRVAVQTHRPAPPVYPPDYNGPPQPVDESKYVKIPKKYHDVATSGLTIEIAAGEQVHNFDLVRSRD